MNVCTQAQAYTRGSKHRGNHDIHNPGRISLHSVKVDKQTPIHSWYTLFFLLLVRVGAH